MDKRFKKLRLNSTLALCYQFVLIVAGFVIPRCILKFYGSDVNGLITSITQFLAFINICDLGISAVVSAAYYKPLADNDTEKISKIFVYSKRFFGIIGFILLAYVTVMLFAYPTLINDTFHFWFTFTLIAAMSISQLGQYFVGISYQLLLNSDQRSYVQLVVNGATLILNTLFSVILMICGASIQVVKLITALIYIMRPLALYLYVKKHYAIDKKIKADGSVILQKKNGIVQHISYMVYENTDVMVLTMFSTLKNISVYSVYVLVTNSIKQIVNAATTGVQSLIGNMIAKREDYRLRSFYLFYSWFVHLICTVLFTITGLMIVPFVELYTTEVNDINYSLPIFAALITFAYYLSCIRNCDFVLIRAAGHFKKTQTASIVECSINLVTSVVLICALEYDLEAVAVGTVLANLFFVIYEAIYFSKNIVFVKIVIVIKQFLADALVFAITFAITFKIAVFNGSILSWIFEAVVVGVICLLVSILIQILLYRDKCMLIVNKFKSLLSKKQSTV